MLEPYSDQPENRGLMRMSDALIKDHVNRFVQDVSASNFQRAITLNAFIDKPGMASGEFFKYCSPRVLSQYRMRNTDVIPHSPDKRMCTALEYVFLISSCTGRFLLTISPTASFLS